MPYTTPMTGEELAEIERLYYDGFSFDAIAAAVGRSSSGVRYQLTQSGHHTPMRRFFSKGDVRHIFALYQRGVRLRCIADRYGTSIGSIGRVLKDAGYTPNRQQPPDEATRDRCVTLYQDGMTISQIARQTGVALMTVKAELVRRGVHDPSRAAQAKREGVKRGSWRWRKSMQAAVDRNMARHR